MVSEGQHQRLQKTNDASHPGRPSKSGPDRCSAIPSVLEAEASLTNTELSAVITAHSQVSQGNRDVRLLHHDASQNGDLKHSYVNVRVSRYARQEIAHIQSETAFRTAGQVIDHLIETAVTKSPIPTASLENIFSDDRPVQLCGGSGTGKSLWLKQIIPAITSRLFLIDLANEYTLPRIGLESLFALKWVRPGNSRVRFVPSPNVEVARVELRTLFSILNTVRHQGYRPGRTPSGRLSTWCVIVEEGHRVSTESEFLTFLNEARKHLHKLIIVASDPELFGKIARTVKPPALQELL